MKLTIAEAATLLDASDERVNDWIEESELPAQKIRGQYWINRTDLLEWATEHNIGVAPRAFRQDRGTPSLAEALRAGGVHDEITGSDFATVLRQIVPRLPLADDADRDTLLQILLGRGSLAVTPVGDGIAIPQVRSPIILAPAGASLALCFCTSLPDLRSLFLLISPTVHVHLSMLAQLAYALKNDEFRGAVKRWAAADEIVRIAASIEEGS
jgi:nitrogen PTS system EIIA component